MVDIEKIERVELTKEEFEYLERDIDLSKKYVVVKNGRSLKWLYDRLEASIQEVKELREENHCIYNMLDIHEAENAAHEEKMVMINLISKMGNREQIHELYKLVRGYIKEKEASGYGN